MRSMLQCMDCGRQYPTNRVLYTCEGCGGLLDVVHDLDALRPIATRALFDSRLGALQTPYASGVWRYKELVYPDLPDHQIVTRPEGNTNLYCAPDRIADYAGVRKVCCSSTRAKTRPARSKTAA